MIARRSSGLMLVSRRIKINQIPGTKIDRISFNYEATNPFEGQGDKYGTIQTPAFDAVQQCLSTPRAEFQDPALAEKTSKSCWARARRSFSACRLDAATLPNHSTLALIMRTNRTKSQVYIGLLQWRFCFGSSSIQTVAAWARPTRTSHISLLLQVIGKTEEPVNEPTLIIYPRKLVEITFDECFNQLVWHIIMLTAQGTGVDLQSRGRGEGI